MTQQPRLLSEEDYYLVLECAKTLGEKLAIALIYNGIRVKELLKIKPENIEIIDSHAILVKYDNTARYIILRDINPPLDWPPHSTQRGIAEMIAQLTLETLHERVNPHVIRKSGAFARRNYPEWRQAYLLGHKPPIQRLGDDEG